MNNNNQFALFPNERKEKETQPDFTGNGEINGIKYRAAGWKNQSKAGKVYLSVKLEQIDDEGNAVVITPEPAKAKAADPFGDGIPF